MVKQWSGGGQAVVKQWSGGGQAVVRRWSGSGQAVVKQLLRVFWWGRVYVFLSGQLHALLSGRSFISLRFIQDDVTGGLFFRITLPETCSSG